MCELDFLLYSFQFSLIQSLKLIDNLFICIGFCFISIFTVSCICTFTTFPFRSLEIASAWPMHGRAQPEFINLTFIKSGWNIVDANIFRSKILHAVFQVIPYKHCPNNFPCTIPRTLFLPPRLPEKRSVGVTEIKSGIVHSFTTYFQTL